MPVVIETPERSSRRTSIALVVTLFVVLLTAAVWTPLVHDVELGGRRAALLGCWRSDADFASKVGPGIAPMVTANGLQFHQVRNGGRTILFVHFRLGRLRWLAGWSSA